jgi:hypothetical protein
MDAAEEIRGAASGNGSLPRVANDEGISDITKGSGMGGHGDARGHFEEPHTERRIGCGTIEVGNYLHAMRKPKITEAGFDDAKVDIIGPAGNLAAVLFCEKEGFGPLFKEVDLANRYDLMIISTKGVSVTAARHLIDDVCGMRDLPLFVLHDFDVAGFMILGTLHRDTRRYTFSSAIEPIDLGLRLEDIGGLEREPAAATKANDDILREQLALNGATDAEIGILLTDRVELNAMASDALIEMIERKLKEAGVEKVIPDDKLLDETYRAFHHSDELREAFEEAERNFKTTEITVPEDLREQVRKILEKNKELRWDDAVRMFLEIPSTISERTRKRSKRPPATSPKPMTTMKRTTAHEPRQQHRPHRPVQEVSAPRPPLLLDNADSSVEKPQRQSACDLYRDRRSL